MPLGCEYQFAGYFVTKKCTVQQVQSCSHISESAFREFGVGGGGRRKQVSAVDSSGSLRIAGSIAALLFHNLTLFKF